MLVGLFDPEGVARVRAQWEAGQPDAETAAALGWSPEARAEAERIVREAEPGQP